MPKFTVKSNILRDGKMIAPGATIELSAEEAAAMPWAVEPLAEQTPPPPPVEKKLFVALKDFQFNKEPVKAGAELELTAEEAEKLGPERIAPAANESASQQ